MKISSIAFSNMSKIPSKYTCEGEDIIPPLLIEDVPEGTKSLALIVHDHDAPKGDFVHCLLWNISPKTSEIMEGRIPSEAKSGTTDFGTKGWGGPCPPSGLHKYEFHLYALAKMLELPESADKSSLRETIQDCTLEETSLIGLYEKEK